jgi:Arc/MetJ-type ribon-helix-helix transcriptional regulator
MPPSPSLITPLTPEVPDEVGFRLRSGRYRGASEVARAVLRLLQREEPGAGIAVQGQAGEAPRTPTSDG